MNVNTEVNKDEKIQYLRFERNLYKLTDNSAHIVAMDAYFLNRIYFKASGEATLNSIDTKSGLVKRELTPQNEVCGLKYLLIMNIKEYIFTIETCEINGLRRFFGVFYSKGPDLKYQFIFHVNIPGNITDWGFAKIIESSERYSILFSFRNCMRIFEISLNRWPLDQRNEIAVFPMKKLFANMCIGILNNEERLFIAERDSLMSEYKLSQYIIIDNRLQLENNIEFGFKSLFRNLNWDKDRKMLIVEIIDSPSGETKHIAIFRFNKQKMIFHNFAEIIGESVEVGCWIQVNINSIGIYDKCRKHLSVYAIE